MVNGSLVGSRHAYYGGGNMLVNIGYCLEDTQPVKSGVIFIPELYSLVLTGAGSGGYRRSSPYTVV